MLKKTITYTDYNDVTRTEDYWFNLSRAELVLMDASHAGGMQTYFERISNEQDQIAIMNCFKDLIHMSVGRKSDDGKRFVKSEEYAVAFEQSEAYSELIMELLSNPSSAAKFFSEILPASLRQDVLKDPAIQSAMSET